MEFPKGFIWGAASSSYQIEGAFKEDGRGESIWDVFSRIPGKVKRGETGGTAADAYHRWREDVALMKEMGLQACRFSVAWPRVDPQGDGRWNQAGLDFYSHFTDALLEAGIQPWVTLFHWDLPQALHRRGGWQNPETADRFASYAGKLAEVLRGRVRRWFTFNEPQCFLGMGYGSGEHAPGLILDDDGLRACWENFCQAHSLAMRILHEVDGENLAGLASTGKTFYPASVDPGDVEAARQMTFALSEGPRTFSHTLALDPLCLGGQYEKPDFIGVNLYHGAPARMGERGPELVSFPDGFPRTSMGWPITPDSLEWGVRFLGERYGLPMVVSENGMANLDRIFLDGGVHDPLRIDFLTRYLRALSRAIEDGSDVRGYFQWSLTDNFEWAEGYDPRFGLVYVDYETGNRTLKDSGRWYGSVICSNGGILF